MVTRIVGLWNVAVDSIIQDAKEDSTKADYLYENLKEEMIKRVGSAVVFEDRTDETTDSTSYVLVKEVTVGEVYDDTPITVVTLVNDKLNQQFAYIKVTKYDASTGTETTLVEEQTPTAYGDAYVVVTSTTVSQGDKIRVYIKAGSGYKCNCNLLAIVGASDLSGKFTLTG